MLATQIHPVGLSPQVIGSNKKMLMLLLNSANQGLWIHFCVPDIDEMDDIFYFIVIEDKFESFTHHLTTSIKELLSLK